MFVTHPSLEQHVPLGFASPHNRFWRGVTLSLETPWYLCVVLSKEKGAVETSLIAWESDLIQLLEAQAVNGDLLSIARMDKSRSKPGRWEFRWIDALWESTCDEKEQVGKVVMRFEGESALRDEHLLVVDPNEARSLRFRASTSE